MNCDAPEAETEDDAVIDVSEMPENIIPSGMSLDRQKYMYEKYDHSAPILWLLNSHALSQKYLLLKLKLYGY